MDTLFFLIKVKVNDQKHHQKQKEKKNKLINIPVWLNSQVPRVNESTNKHLTHLTYKIKIKIKGLCTMRGN